MIITVTMICLAIGILFLSFRLEHNGIRILMTIAGIILIINSVVCAIIVPITYLRSLRDYGELMSHKNTMLIEEGNKVGMAIPKDLVDKDPWYRDTLSKYRVYNSNPLTRLFIARLPEELR